MFFALSLDLRSEEKQIETSISRDEIQMELDANQQEWAQRLQAEGPHLFFDQIGWEKLAKNFKEHPNEVEDVISRARTLAAKPVPEYIDPLKLIASGKETELDAQQELWEREVGNDLVLLAFAARLVPDESIRKRLKETVLAACRYPTWGNTPLPNMDLACAHLARGIAIAWDWNRNLWNDPEKALIIKTIQERVSQLSSGACGAIYWSRFPADNHNHVANAALGLCGIAFFNDIPEAPTWLAVARNNFKRVEKAFPADGGSHEGVSYWSYALSFILQYIEGTRVVTDSAKLYEAPFLKNAAAYRLGVSTSGLEGTLPWGDAVARDFYGPQHILYGLANQYHDSSAQWLADSLPWKQPETWNRDIPVWILFWRNPAIAPQPPRQLDFHLDAQDLVTTRSGWEREDYVLAIKSGFNNRNHTHLDSGSLALAFGGEWLLSAPGYGKGKGDHAYWEGAGGRWDYYSNATESHATLLIDGKNQRFDHEARGVIESYFSSPFWVWTDLDLSNAYKGTSEVRRQVLHRRGSYIAVFDSIEAPSSLKAEWLAQFNKKPVLSETEIAITGSTGNLTIQMLQPQRPFLQRNPTSPKIDQPPSSIHAYSVGQEGKSLSFVALLQPLSGVSPRFVLQAATAESEGHQTTTIEGKDWTDRLVRTIGTRNSQAGASLTATRIDSSGHLESYLAINTTKVELDQIQSEWSAPGKFALQRIRDGLWVVVTDRELTKSTKLPSGHTLSPLPRKGTEYQYVLAERESAVAEATQWLTEQARPQKQSQ